MAAVKAPVGLGVAGLAVWAGVADKYQLRGDELRVLEDAAAEADLIETLKAGLVGQPLLVRGSQGQSVIHPIVSELRQHRSTLAGLLRQLKLPDENSTDVGAALSAKNRAAANARWSRRGA